MAVAEKAVEDYRSPRRVARADEETDIDLPSTRVGGWQGINQSLLTSAATI